MRHVTIRPGERVDADALTALIRGAYSDITQRLQSEADHRSRAQGAS
jgi:hypothetical protein